MNKKVLIKEVLKSWYFIDSVLLNGHAKKTITEQNDYNEYISTKAALLSNLFELYCHTEYDPADIKIPNDSKQLQESAVKAAKKSKAVATSMIQDKKFVDHMKKVVLKESKNRKENIKIVTEDVINTRFLKMTLDNILVGLPLLESKNPVKDFKSEILEETYLMMRSNLVNIAKKYNNFFFQEQKQVNEAFRLLGAAIISVLGFKLIGSVGRSIEAFSDRCHNRCGTLRLNLTAKRICVLNCKIQTHQRIIGALRQSAAQTNNEKAREKLARDVRRAQMKIAQFQREVADLKGRSPGAAEIEPSIQARTY